MTINVKNFLEYLRLKGYCIVHIEMLKDFCDDDMRFIAEKEEEVLKRYNQEVKKQ